MPEISKYHQDLASLLNSEPNRAQRRAFLIEERQSPEYQAAKKEAFERNHKELTPLEQTIVWAERTLGEYNNLPKGNSQERKKVKEFLERSAEYLLQNPQEIDTAVYIWDTYTGSFYQLIKKESVELIKKNWKDITSEQLADLIKVDTNSPSTQDFTKEMLGSYFKGPNNRRQRIDAYYRLAYSALHLIEDDKAFTQALRIGLHDTDILPKDPNLIEQTLLLSLPYAIFLNSFPNSPNGTKDLLSLVRDNNEERDFQKLLIAKNVMFKLSFFSLEDLEEVRQKHYDFLATDENLIGKWKKELSQAVKQLGSDKVEEINNATVEFDLRREDTLSEEEKLKLKNIWPFNLFFDETDPLNQKFQEVRSRLASSV